MAKKVAGNFHLFSNRKRHILVINKTNRRNKNSMNKMVEELNNLKKSHNQYVVTCECESSKINDILTKELESSSRLVNHIKNGNDIFLIFEK